MMGSIFIRLKKGVSRLRKRLTKLRKTRTPKTGLQRASHHKPKRKVKVSAFKLMPQKDAPLKKEETLDDFNIDTPEQEAAWQQIQLEHDTLAKLILLFEFFPKSRKASHQNIAGKLNVDRTTISRKLAQVQKIGILLKWHKDWENYKNLKGIND